MRVTLTLRHESWLAAHRYAEDRKLTLDAAVSELILCGAAARPRYEIVDGFPLVRTSPKARTITLEDVKSIEDEIW